MKEIIIAEDDPAIRDIFKLILERAGYSIYVYYNGEALLRDDLKLPDLFLIDKQLSGIDGLEICRHLKKNDLTKSIPVIVTSASPYVATIAIAAGADAFIEKPFKIKDLLNLIEQTLSKNYFTAPI